MRWFRRQAQPDLQLLAELSGVCARQEALERQGRAILDALKTLEQSTADALVRCEAAAQQPAVVEPRPMPPHCPLMPCFTGVS